MSDNAGNTLKMRARMSQKSLNN